MLSPAAITQGEAKFYNTPDRVFLPWPERSVEQHTPSLLRERSDATNAWGISTIVTRGLLASHDAGV